MSDEQNQDQEQSQEETQENVNTTVQEESKEATPIDVEAIKQQAAREVAALYMGALGEKDRQLEEFRKQAAAPRPQAVEEEVDGAQFLNAPKKHIAEIVQRELQQQLAPIQDLWGQFSRSKQLEQAKHQLAQVPNYRELLTTYGDVVDQLVGSNNPTTQAVEAAILMIPGLVATGRVPMREQASKSQFVTPNITPSSPTPPKKAEKKETANMTDQEKEIARRFRMTDEDFMKYKQADSNVGDWK